MYLKSFSLSTILNILSENLNMTILFPFIFISNLVLSFIVAFASWIYALNIKGDNVHP